MSSAGHGEGGTTLVEMVIATAVMLVVIAAVGTAVTQLAGDTGTMTRSAQAIDDLQIAEQAIVKDIHAATAWCATPSSTELEFMAGLAGSSEAYAINITSTNELTLATAASCSSLGSAPAQVLLTNVDSAATTPVSERSGFSQPNGPSAVTEAGSDYYDSISVTLTVDNPSVGAYNVVRTTVGDPEVMIWNTDEQCQLAWQEDEVGDDPC